MKMKLPDHEKWEASALCYGQAPLYEVPEASQGGSSRYTIELKWEFMQRADRCLDCPVMIQCLESASEEDFWWTIRGGRMPGVMAKTDIRLPFPTRVTASGVTIRTCKNGHPYDTTPRYGPGIGHCLACLQERTKGEAERAARKRRERRQAEGLALPQEVIDSGVCPSGHDISDASSINRLGNCRFCADVQAREKKLEGQRKRDRAARARRKEENAARLVDITREAFAVQLMNDNRSPDASLIQYAHELGALSASVPASEGR